MVKTVRAAVVMIVAFAMIFCANGISWSQDDEGGGGDAGDAGGIAESNAGGSDIVESEKVESEESVSEERYEEAAAPVSTVSTVTTTSTTHTYVPRGYVYDDSSNVVAGAVAGAVVGAAVGSAAAGAAKGGARTDQTTKRPAVIKKTPAETKK